ncbi:MAG: B12-binding domain-containing radical SAM protein [Spirochaetaceae bacterium]|jgi:radical SAM superfamily enzyme YgiQ (UPF0313 family)|nr:B12-binding domain-containing radical SAM protein [Spirochaetaceae bacterium]
MPNILLVAINAKWIHPALSLRLLKANLGSYESQAEILEFALRQPVTEQADLIIEARPRILGISVSIWNHKATAELLQILDKAWRKDAAPKPAVILGGPEASHLPAEADLFQYADWIIRGEGEQAFRELCGTVLDGLPAPPLKITAAPPAELAELDPGYRLYTDEDLRRKLIYVEASRGCPFGCEFCLSSRSGLREFPLDSFLKEMDVLIRRGAKAFKFLDRSFNLNIPRARRILEFFLERLVPPQYVHFEMIPSRFPLELRQTVSAFPPGTLRLELGIQTFNPVTAELIGRQSDPEKELEVLRFLSEKTNAIVHTDLIAGLPAEDISSFAAGFDRLWQAGPTEIQVGILKCLPGTPLNRHTASQQMRYALEPPYEVSETGALSRPELDRIKNFARFWEIIVNRGAFGGFSDALFPRRQGVFSRFMDLSDRLLRRFGRNWGIPQQDLGKALESG